MAQTKIKGRDKTTPTKYSIHLSIMLDWYPVIGRVGYAVYSSYVMITALGIEIGTRKLANHLGISRPSFILHTELLDMIGLVKLHRGTATRCNVVDILDPPPVNPGTLSDIRAAVLEDTVLSRESVSYFRDALLTRLDAWSSLSDHIDFDLIQVPMPTANGNGKPNGGPAPAAPIATTGDTSDDLLARLEKIRFDNAADWLADKDQALVAAWLNELENSDLKKRVKLPAGFIRAKVEEGKYPVNPSAPAGMRKCMHCEETLIPDYATYCDDCADELGIQR